jgi:hypothetical protein
MNRLKTWKLFVAMMASWMLVGVQGAMAKKYEPDEIKSMCAKGGGLYLPPAGLGAYGCYTQGGSLVICDGQVPKGQPYCGVYRTIGGGPLSKRQMRQIGRARGTASP